MNLRAAEPSVELRLADWVAVDWDRWPTLDKDRFDDQIVAMTLCLRDNANKVILVSHDSGMWMAARQLGLDLFQVPEDWLRPPESDEQQRKVEALQAELKQEREQHPQLQLRLLSVTGQEIDEVGIQVEQVPRLSDAQLDFLREAASRKWQMRLDAEYYLAKTQLSLAEQLENSFVDKNRRYQEEEYPTFLEKVRKYFEQLPLLLELPSRCLKVVLDVHIAGRVPAKNLDIELRTSPSIGLIETLAEPELVFPSPPAPPQRDRYGLPKKFNMAPSAGMSRLLKGMDLPGPETYFGNGAELSWGEIETDESGSRANLGCRELRHQTSQRIEMVVAVGLGGENGGAISFQASASNLPVPRKFVVPVRPHVREVPFLDAARAAGVATEAMELLMQLDASGPPKLDGSAS